MSTYLFLCCDKTGECVEVIAHVGSKIVPRLPANAVGAFLVYHEAVAPGAGFAVRELEAFSAGRNVFSSLSDAAEDFAQVGGLAGYVDPVLVWTEANYHELMARRPRVAGMLREIEGAGAVWTRNC